MPELIDADNDLLVIEMTIVERPFVLDFAGAKWPEEIPDFEQDTMDEHFERIRDLFDERWSDALHVAEAFHECGASVWLHY